MYKFGGNNSSGNFKTAFSNGSPILRQIPHSRVEDEDAINKKYEFGRKLGQGSFGVVYEIRNKDTEERFAIKIINKEKGGGKSAINFENEVTIMKTVTHQNLIKLEEVFETKKKLYLITELCQAGELAKWIKKLGPIPENQARIIMKQIVDAISYLHKHDIVHRDLKLENILLKEFDPETETFLIKITDFGLSSQRETVGTESMFDDYCGTPLYMAPEIIDNYPYSQLCDVWALGIIMFTILTSHSPFTAETESKLRDQIRRAEINVNSSSYTRLSEEAKDCLTRMIKVNPAHRITSSELCDHPWFLDKKLDEMPDKQKNVLELMSEMLQEQENNRYLCALKDISHNETFKSNGDKSETENTHHTDSRTNSSKNIANKTSNTKFNSARTDKKTTNINYKKK